ncbi:MAG: glycosyltransferase, partial [Coxiellaceae bacterium]|nr:glycosyltransferase [Coxiellaceae bacterium]
DSKKIVVLLPARMLWDKGVSEFVQAADYLRKKIDIRMVLVGPIDSGNPSSITQQQIDIWVKQGLVEYWGFQKDIREAYQQCHIVCLPSYREGTPRALIEAAACSRAIVATDVPGCRDIVIDNENGLLVPAQNALALAAAIEVLVKNPQMRAMMAARGREIVEEGFSAQLVNQKTLDVYKVLSTPLSA